ncbi:ATP synthase subunit I [Saccharibacillus sacchari]|uniref:ATP synthase subunit I n=1 Tax=Saccharibacillus sacchari TaxID=456493 RepID=A0ACC6P6W2_9BACL
MDELPRYMRWLTRITYTVLLMGAIWMLIAPHHHPVLLGIVFGVSISCISMYYLGYKVKKLTDAAAEGRKYRGGIGFSWRVIAAIGTVVVAIEFPYEVNLQVLLACIVIAPLILLVLGITFNIKSSKEEMAYFQKKRQDAVGSLEERSKKDA